MIRGALAAAVTPLADGGFSPDEEAIGPLVEFLAAAGLDGLLALGTTGEGILLSALERKRVAERFLEARSGRFTVAVHCGAQTTADTVVLAAHAAEAGADAVAVIAPPYFRLDEAAILAHFSAAARACTPTPFYVYEFERVSGYAVAPSTIDALREVAPNLAGLKVSDTPFDRFAPYLLEGLDVLVGPEALIYRGLEHGATGAVSGLATAFPELVAAAVHGRSADATDRAGAIRGEVERFPRHAALKRILRVRGVPIREDVRLPLRPLLEAERDELDAMVPAWLESLSPAS